MNYYNYFTEIEEHFLRRRGKGLLVSPMDWSLIATWRDTGVPLHVALRGIDVAMDSYFSSKRRKSEKVRTLFYCHDSVMAEYARHLESHLGENPAEGPTQPEASGGPSKEQVKKFLQERIAEIKALQAKQSDSGAAEEEIARVVGRLEEIARDVEQDRQPDLESLERDLGILDESLVTTLRALLPEDHAVRWQEEARKELKVYRKRLPKETYARILENFMRRKIHQHFGLGELSLFQL